MKCKFCRKAIRFWQWAQYVPTLNTEALWSCGGMAHSVCFEVYNEGFTDGKDASTPLKKGKK